MRTKVITKAVLSRPDGKILIIRRSATDVRRPLQWDFPGGNVDDGEHVDEAIVREIKEETGLVSDGHQLRLVHAVSDTYVPPGGQESADIVWLFYVGQVKDTGVRLSHEHDLFEWVDREELLEKLVYPRHKEIVGELIKEGLIG